MDRSTWGLQFYHFNQFASHRLPSRARCIISKHEKYVIVHFYRALVVSSSRDKHNAIERYSRSMDITAFHLIMNTPAPNTCLSRIPL